MLRNFLLCVFYMFFKAPNAIKAQRITKFRTPVFPEFMMIPFYKPTEELSPDRQFLYR